jgi:hypothetical protein
MSDKIKRLAKNITELLANTETPQETYYSLLKVLKKQKDYFQHMSPDNVIKLYLNSFPKPSPSVKSSLLIFLFR